MDTSPRWAACSQIFDPEGGNFREIHLRHQSIEDSIRVIEFLRATFPSLHFVTRPSGPVPSAKEVYAIESEKDQVLYFTHEGLGLYCYPMKPGAFELSLDVREVESQDQLDSLNRLMSELGKHLDSDLDLTPENLAEQWMMRFQHADGKLHINVNAESGR